MRIIRALFFIFICLQLVSCGKLILGSDPKSTPLLNFDLLWSDYDQYYSRFDYKNVNWDSLYHECRANIHLYTDELMLSRIVGAMLYHLKDMHAILRTHWGDYRYFDLVRGQFHQNFDLDNVKNNYLSFVTIHHVFIYGQLTDDIGYIHINSFGKADTKEAFDDFDNILQHLSQFEGLVIDIRNNEGGFSSHAKMVASRFTDEQRLYLYWQFRNGRGTTI